MMTFEQKEEARKLVTDFAKADRSFIERNELLARLWALGVPDPEACLAQAITMLEIENYKSNSNPNLKRESKEVK